MDRHFFLVDPKDNRCYCSFCGKPVMQDAYNLRKHSADCFGMDEGRDIMQRLRLHADFGYRVSIETNSKHQDRMSDDDDSDPAAYKPTYNLIIEICAPEFIPRPRFQDRYQGAKWKSILKAVYRNDGSKKVDIVYNNSLFPYDVWLALIRKNKLVQVQTEDTTTLIGMVFPQVYDIYSLQMFDFIYRNRGYERKVCIPDQYKSRLLKPRRHGVNLFAFKDGKDTHLILRVEVQIFNEPYVFLFSGDDMACSCPVMGYQWIMEHGVFRESEFMKCEKLLFLKFADRYPELGLRHFVRKHHCIDYFMPLIAAHYHVGLEMLSKCGLVKHATFHRNLDMTEVDPGAYSNLKQLYGLPVRLIRQLDQVINVYDFEQKINIKAKLDAVRKAYQRNPAFLQGDITPRTMSFLEECMLTEVRQYQKMTDQQLLKIIRHVSQMNEYDYTMYRDYLRMCMQMEQFPCGLTPKDELEAHETARMLYQVQKDRHISQAFEDTVQSQGYRKLAIKDQDYEIHCPKTLQDLYHEGKAMHNCVYLYRDYVILGKSRIYFLRRSSEPKKSFGTLEVSRGKLVQAKAFANGILPDDAREYLRDWCRKMKIAIATSDV